MTPEQIHLALNHFPTIGLILAMIPLLVGLITRQRTTAFAGVLVMGISALATPFIMSSGEDAYERYEEGPVSPYLDAAAEPALEQHEERAHTWSKLLYADLIIAIAGLVALGFKPVWVRPVSAICLAGCLAGSGASSWIAYSGGKIRRPDMRTAVSQPAQTSTPHEESNNVKEYEHEHDD